MESSYQITLNARDDITVWWSLGLGRMFPLTKSPCMQGMRSLFDGVWTLVGCFQSDSRKKFQPKATVSKWGSQPFLLIFLSKFIALLISPLCECQLVSLQGVIQRFYLDDFTRAVSSHPFGTSHAPSLNLSFGALTPKTLQGDF